MGQRNDNFKPTGNTVNLVVGATTANLTLPTDSHAGTGTFRFVNVGTQVVFFKLNAGGASLTTSTPILPNTTELFDIDPATTIIAAIAAAVGSTVYVTPGVGN